MEVNFIEVEEVSIKTCRCCLFFSEEPMDDIFECEYAEIELQEILNLLAPIEVTPDDGFSHYICDRCKEQAINYYKFRQTCLVSNDQMRAELNEESDEEIYEELEVANETDIIETDEQIYRNDLSDNQEIIEDCIQVLEDPPVEQDPPVLNKSSKKHECHLCGKRFETPSKLQRHMIVHRDVLHPSIVPERPTKALKYICEICDKLVETPSKLQRHMRVHEKNQKIYGINQHRPYPCSHCEMRFWDKVKLDRHLIIHSEAFQSSKIQHLDGHLFTCVICLQKVPDYEECMQHMRNHREDFDETAEIACKLCPKVYPKLANLIRHSKVHAENATHQCIYCGKKMGIGDDFIEHMLRHEGFKPYICDMPSCGKKFVKIHILRQHMETHVETKSFVCNLCNKNFTEQEYLKRHLKRHSGRKDHVCNICQARFTFKSGLTSHMTTHSLEKLFACNTCSSKFGKPSSLRLHQKIHTGEKKFVCDFCNMRFITSGHLRRHKLTHNGLKPFSCQFCNKSYTQSNDLIKHLRTHLGPNVYKCDIDDCTEAFPKFSELKNHKIIHYSAHEGEIETMKLL